MKNAPAMIPAGPADGESRVLRGGSWYDYRVGSFRCGIRDNDGPVNGDDYFGFRCVVRAGG